MLKQLIIALCFIFTVNILAQTDNTYCTLYLNNKIIEGGNLIGVYDTYLTINRASYSYAYSIIDSIVIGTTVIIKPITKDKLTPYIYQKPAYIAPIEQNKKTINTHFNSEANNSTANSETALIALGAIQIGMGAAGMIGTIMNANSSYSFSYNDTPTHRTTTTIDNEWNSGHTVWLCVSLSTIISGITTCIIATK